MMTKIKLIKLFFLGLLSLFVSACSTITFVQHEQEGQQPSTNRWHHATLNGMVELSRPLDVSEICTETAWTKITTEHTLANALITSVVPATSFFSPYSAWTNKVNCYEKEVIK